MTTESSAENQTLRILQISDIHSATWHSEPAAKSAQKTFRKLATQFEAVFSSLVNQRKCPDCVVFCGDFVNLGQMADFQCLQTHFFHYVKQRITEHEKVPGNKEIKTFAVPGNHDANRENSDRPFFQFEETLRKCVTHPYEEGGSTVVALEENKIPAIIWLVNSAVKSGMTDIDGEVVDPGFVGQSDLDAVTGYVTGRPDGECGDIRIVVLHHNPFSFSENEHNNATMNRYGFINSGVFCDFLIENSFSIVLHGHQHRSRVSHYSHQKKSLIGPRWTHEDGFVCVGAPEFGAGNRSGFNLIEIISDGDCSWFEVVIREFDLHLAGKTEEVRSTSFHRSGKTALNHGLLLKASAFIRKNPRNKEILRLVDPVNSRQEEFIERMMRLKVKFPEVRAHYALTVFPPEIWGTRRLGSYHGTEAGKNLPRAMWKGMEEYGKDSPRLVFTFSDPLCKAIERAKRNSSILRAQSRYLEAVRNGLINRNYGHFSHLVQEFNRTCDLMEATALQAADSLSIWDNGSLNPLISKRIGKLPRMGSLPVEIRNLGIRPQSYYPNDEMRAEVEKLWEFPRILLWDEKQFDSPEALDCIVFHSNFGFPLFWLAPTRLQGRTRDKPRRRWGTLSVLPWFRAEREHQIPVHRSEELANDEEGGDPWPNGHGEYIPPAWNDDYPGRLTEASTLLEEYLLLLERPDILFADDVWAIRQIGPEAWESLKTMLSALDEECVQWSA